MTKKTQVSKVIALQHEPPSYELPPIYKFVQLAFYHNIVKTHILQLSIPKLDTFGVSQPVNFIIWTRSTTMQYLFPPEVELDGMLVLNLFMNLHFPR